MSMSKNVTSAGNQQGSRLSNWQLDPSETTRRIPQMDKSLAQLLAILFTDGCVSPKYKKSWRIYFANKSKVLIDLFKDCMESTFGLEGERIRQGITADGLFRAIVNSKQIGNFLVNKYGNFRTLCYSDGTIPTVNLPVQELLASGNAEHFLRVAFSCDGGISFYPAYRAGKNGGTKWLIRTVFLACKHEQLRKDYVDILSHLGIEAREVGKDGKIKLERKSEIAKFYKKVGFVKGVKATNDSKYWSGVEKQSILKTVITSYKNPSAIYNLPKFHSR